jgi:hypothetical protein
MPTLDFSRAATERTGHHRNRGVLRNAHPYLRLNRFQGVCCSSRKENSTPDTVRLHLSSWFASPRMHTPVKGWPSPAPGYGILTVFPFAIDQRQPACTRSCDNAQQRTGDPFQTRAFATGLGSTDPHATAVHVEPLPTSVHKVLTCVFATTTKICTDRSSGQAHAQRPSTQTVTTLLLVVVWSPAKVQTNNQQQRLGMSGSL